MQLILIFAVLAFMFGILPRLLSLQGSGGTGLRIRHAGEATAAASAVDSADEEAGSAGEAAAFAAAAAASAAAAPPEDGERW